MMRVADDVACKLDPTASSESATSTVDVDDIDPRTPSRTFSALSPRKADLLALAVRGLLDRVTVPLARAAATFSDGYGWHEAGYAWQSDDTRECFGRSSRWLRELAWIGRSIALWPRLGAALSGDDGQPPLGQEAAYHIARVADETTIEAWIRHARKTKIRPLKKDLKQALEAGRPRPPDLEAPDLEAVIGSDVADLSPPRRSREEREETLARAFDD
ncbi:MAG: hypothetical protein JSV80_00405 [Acidobacteriota bacterium]|nr:MAG: hypothetical protein JSV80_00405 [Acidobacteriota bacterium]